MFKTVELGEVLNYEQPTRYIVESDIYNDEYDVPVLTAGKSFILGYTNEKENIYQNYPVIIFDDFTTATKYVDFPFKVKSSAMKILSCDENIADIKFLFYLIQTIKINSEQHQRYWISKFSKIQIPLPPLATQKAIAEKLDKADALHKKDQELLKQYDELAQSIFIEMFGDPVQNEKGWEMQLGNSCLNVIGGGTFRSGDYVDKGIPLIRIGAVNKGYFDKESLVYLPENYASLYSRYIIKSGDLLVTLTGTVGKDDYGNVFIIGNDFDKYLLNQRVAKLLLNKDKLDKFYFSFLLQQNQIKSILTNVNRGVRQANISNDDFYNLEILIPPINLQNQFAEKIKNIEVQKALVKQQAQQSEDLFQALLQQSFTF